MSDDTITVLHNPPPLACFQNIPSLQKELLDQVYSPSPVLGKHSSTLRLYGFAGSGHFTQVGSYNLRLSISGFSPLASCAQGAPVCQFFTPSYSWITFHCIAVVQSPSRVWLCATPWIAARQASLSMGFCRQEYWSGLPCPPGNLPNSGIEPVSLMSPALEDGFFTSSTTSSTPDFPLNLCKYDA